MSATREAIMSISRTIRVPGGLQRQLLDAVDRLRERARATGGPRTDQLHLAFTEADRWPDFERDGAARLAVGFFQGTAAALGIDVLRLFRAAKAGSRELVDAARSPALVPECMTLDEAHAVVDRVRNLLVRDGGWREDVAGADFIGAVSRIIDAAGVGPL